MGWWFSKQREASADAAAETPSPVRRAFEEYFASWGLFLPVEAEAQHARGYLLGKGWSVRWRWQPDGALEFLASHRMTNERWHVIAVDGSLGAIDVPFEAMIFPPNATDEQRAAIEQEYRSAWSAHGEAVRRAEMDPIQGRGDVPNDLAGPDLMTWRLDGGEWAAAPLRAVGD